MALSKYKNQLAAEVENYQGKEDKPEQTPAEAKAESEKKEPKEAEAETKQNASVPEKSVKKTTPKKGKKQQQNSSAVPIPDGFMTRGTFYLTYEEMEAISAIAYEEMEGKSALMRSLLDEALEKKKPGILKQVSERAGIKKQRDFTKMSEEDREKLIAKSEKA